MGQWNEEGATVPMQALPRSAAQLAGVPAVGDVALGAGAWFFDPEQVVDEDSARVYYSVSSDGQKYVGGGNAGSGGVGPAGPANVLTIGTVTTLAAGSPATASIGGTSPNQHLDLGLPVGAPGLKGNTGNTGATPNLTIGTVQTGAAGSSAGATITGTATDPVLNLAIPRGAKGDTGDKGDTGNAGPAGPPITEVTLTTDHTLSSADTNTVFKIGVAGLVITVPGTLAPNEPYIGVRWTDAAASVILRPVGGAKINGGTVDVTASCAVNAAGLDLGAQLANQYWVGGDGTSGTSATPAQTAAGATAGFIAATPAGTMVGPDPTGPLNARNLAGRPTPFGRRKALVGGSETARSQNVLTINAGNFVANASTKVITVQTAVQHLLHDGAEVFLAAEDALAPVLNGGTVTVDNMFCYGKITVVDATHFTVPYWDANAGTAYDTLGGTSTIAFFVFTEQLLSPNGKFWEMNRWLGFPYELVANFATGSNNTMNLIERIPAVVSMVKAGLISELGGTFGVGNTLLYGMNHSWTLQQMIDRIVLDVTAWATALSPYGVPVEVETPIAQADASGMTTGGTMAVIDALRTLAMGDPSLRLTIVDDFQGSYDPATGQERTRFRRNGTDNVHPANEGAVYFGHNHAKSASVAVPFWRRLARSPLDSYKAESTDNMRQYFDPFVTATPMVVASTLDAKCSGNVPDLVTAITTAGNASRSASFTYEKMKGVWYMVCRLNAAAAGDTFGIKLANKAGVRNLLNIFTAKAGRKFMAMADFAFIPDDPDAKTWTSIDCYMQATMSYRSLTNRQAYLAADSLNYGTYKDGPMTSPRLGPAFMQRFVIPAGSTTSDAGLFFVATAAAAGSATLLIASPTLRDIT